MSKRKKRKQRCETQRPVVSNEEAAITRLMKALSTIIFSFGSIWAVGEELWQEKLPAGYGESGRGMHPGICVNPSNATMFSATVMMLFGTHSHDHLRPEFSVPDLWGEGDPNPCNFGAFPPVGFDPMAYGNDKSEVRTHIRPYKGRMRMLSSAKQDELRRFLHDIYAWEDRA